MMHVDFEGANVVMAKPPSMTDEECLPLNVMKLTGDLGTQYVSCWRPSKEDIEAIVAGRPIWLIITANWHPPVALVTTDSDLAPNV